jgi:hypothetical protein
MKKPIPIAIGAKSREAALLSITAVIDRCKFSSPDEAVDYELRELEALKSAVEDQWPLDAEVKKQMDIGPFAAKNISDWNAGLAHALMSLDYELRHDGVSLVVNKSHSEPPVAEHSVTLSRARRA